MIIYVWPDGDWCDADEVGKYDWKSDDYEMIVLPTEWEVYCRNDGNYYSYGIDCGVMVRNPDNKVQAKDEEEVKKILFVDLDGTIRQTKSGKTFINDPKDQQLIPGAMQALKRYHDKNWLIVGITNQGGVPQFMTLADAIAGCYNTIELSQGLIKAVFMAPGMDGEYCWKISSRELINVSRVIPRLAGTYRKPGTGMVEFACDHFSVEPNNCLFVGDRPEDDLCAAAAEIDFILADRWRQDEGGQL